MEKNVKTKIYVNGLSLFLFFVGGMIYLMFRSESLVMFRWCEMLHIKKYVDSLRISYILPQWVIYSLPDGLWLCSYVLFVSAIWNFDLKQGWPYIFSLPAIAIGSELAQAFGWINGTFDWIDLVCYVFGLLAGCMIVEYLKLRDNEKEKKRI